MKKIKEKKIMIFTLIGLMFISVVGFTYAYFVLTVSGNDMASEITISNSVLHVTYVGGNEINAEEISPGWSATKTITITNDGTDGVTYKLYFQNLLNEILGSTSSTNTMLTTNSELKISATCTNTSTSGTVPACSGIDKTSVAITNDNNGNQVSYENLIKDKIYIAAGETQTYTLTFEFENTSYPQNYNQNKNFIAKIGVVDSNAKYDVIFTGLDSIETITVSSTPQTVSVTNGTAIATGLELGTHTIKIGDTTNTFELRTADTASCTNTGTKVIYADNESTAQAVELALDASNNVTEYSIVNLPQAKTSLENYSWAEIKILSNALVSNTITESILSSAYHISLGSEKETTINGETHTFRIVGFKHDTDSGGNTIGITFDQVDLMDDLYQMNLSMTSSDGWSNSRLINIINAFTLPDDLNSSITAAKKKCVTNVSTSTFTYVTTKLWIMSETEATGKQTYTRGGLAEGTQYKYFIDVCGSASNNACDIRSKKRLNVTCAYYLRSPYFWSDTRSRFARTFNDGIVSYDRSTYELGVAISFCI